MNTATDNPTQPEPEHGARLRDAVGTQHWPTRPLGVLVLLAGLATLSYANTFSAAFHFDDVPHIVENRQIRSGAVVREVASSRYIGFLSFAVNYHVGGLQVGGYHLVNLLIHVTNGFLVYTLVGLLGRTPGLGGIGAPFPRQADGVALITALVFVVHPIQTQAVTYLVQRFTNLATLFYLLAVVCYLRWRLADSTNRTRAGWYVGALVATILAMKTKEISFTLPVLLLVLDGVGFGRPRGKQWGPWLPFLLALLIIPLSLPGGLGETAAGFARETTNITRLSYLFTQGRVLVTYLRLLVWPVHQNLDYDYPLYDSLLALPVVLSGLLLVALVGLALYLVIASTRWRLAGVGLLWFFLTLAVESSIIPIRDVIYEHRLYLPSVGVLLAGSTVAVPLLARWRALALTLGVGVVLLFAEATYQRNRVWHDGVSLWSDVVARSPAKARGYSNLGLAYASQGRWEKAIRYYTMALQRKPDFPEAHSNLGQAYAEQGRWEEAISEFMTALRFKPKFPEAHINLGNAYLQQGRVDEAITEFMSTIKIKPELPYAHFNLANAYLRQGRLEAAVTEFVATVRLQPDLPEAHASLGDIYATQNRMEDAIEAYRTALRLQPDAPDAHNNLGILYAREARPVEAVAEFSAALQLRPEFPEAHYNLGSAYARQGQLDEAISEYLTALRLKPDFPEVHYDLGNAYRLKGLTQEAHRHYELALRLQPGLPPAQHGLEALDAQPESLK